MKTYTSSRSVQLPDGTFLNEEIVRQFDNFFSSVRPSDLRDTLIEIYHNYVVHEHQAFPIEFDRMSMQMYLLIDLLKRIDGEIERPYPPFQDGEIIGEVQDTTIIWLLKESQSVTSINEN